MVPSGQCIIVVTLHLADHGALHCIALDRAAVRLERSRDRRAWFLCSHLVQHGHTALWLVIFRTHLFCGVADVSGQATVGYVRVTLLTNTLSRKTNIVKIKVMRWSVNTL